MRFALVCLLALAWPAHAEERMQIALLELGPHGAAIRGDVMRLAATRCWVSAAADLDGRSLRDFATDYELDLVVVGSVEKRAHDYEVRIHFVHPATGRRVANVFARVKQPALDRIARRRIDAALVRALGTTKRMQ